MTKTVAASSTTISSSTEASAVPSNCRFEELQAVQRYSAEEFHGPVLFSSTGADRRTAEQQLLEAPDPVFVRFAGGCLSTQVKDFYIFDVLKRTFVDLSGDGQDFRGIGVIGGSEARLRDTPEIVRPSFPDIGPVLERLCPEARFMGIFPGQMLEEAGSGLHRIREDNVSGQVYDIYANRFHRACMYSEKTAGYFWNGETELCQDLESSLNQLRPLRVSAYLFFEGDQGVGEEIQRVAAESRQEQRKHLVLITGGSDQSAPSRFARDQRFLQAHSKNVHVVNTSPDAIDASASRLRETLARLTVFSRAA